MESEQKWSIYHEQFSGLTTQFLLKRKFCTIGSEKISTEFQLIGMKNKILSSILFTYFYENTKFMSHSRITKVEFSTLSRCFMLFSQFAWMKNEISFVLMWFCIYQLINKLVFFLLLSFFKTRKNSFKEFNQDKIKVVKRNFSALENYNYTPIMSLEPKKIY